MTLKRTMDLTLSVAALLLLAPVMGLVAGLIFFKMGSPVLFTQERPGEGGRPFRVYKFRTMSEAFDGNGQSLPDAQRLTALGVLLRKLSVDELPQLLNVLKGDMSLVGPRPLLMEYLPLYSAEQARRHEVRPGITGWAQVNGRNALSWDDKFRLDVWYVDNQNIWLDIKILFMTVRKVLMRDGIAAQGEVTMPRFTGNKNSEGLRL
jgi:lipopolysaccharide/colanic/teichoic acid biosynthesis glycosyltransferase